MIISKKYAKKLIKAGKAIETTVITDNGKGVENDNLENHTIFEEYQNLG